MSIRVLVIATHPDDEVLGCGGVIARYSAEGADVHVLVVTRGSTDVFPTEFIEQGRRELAEAHRILGISGVRFLDLPAPKLDTIPGHLIAERIKQCIDELQPRVVYLPHFGDLHSDHRAVFFAALVATRPIHDSPVKKILSYETLSETEWAPPSGSQVFVPTVFVDVSQYLGKKLEAMRCYASQLQAPPHPRSLQGIQALAQLRGSTVSCDAAEAFMLVREIIR